MSGYDLIKAMEKKTPKQPTWLRRNNSTIRILLEKLRTKNHKDLFWGSWSTRLETEPPWMNHRWNTDLREGNKIPEEAVEISVLSGHAQKNRASELARGEDSKVNTLSSMSRSLSKGFWNATTSTKADICYCGKKNSPEKDRKTY